MAFDKKAYQREYARNKYRSLTPEEKKIRNSSDVVKRAKVRYRSNPANREKENRYNSDWYQRNKEYKNGANRLRRYGLTKDEYESMVISQEGLCAICKNEPEKKIKLAAPDGFAIDHDHITGKVRGLLCEPCNRMLGAAKDSTQTLTNAVDYLLRN